MFSRIGSVAARACAASALALALASAGGCLMTTTAPPVDPGLDKLPAGNVSAREQLVVSQLKTIKRAEDFYLTEKGQYGSLSDLMSSSQLNQTPTGLGYLVEIKVTDGGTKYVVEAVPKEYGPMGKRSFYMDESGTIRGGDHQGGAPQATDPVVP
jgi:hypothetical protein